MAPNITESMYVKYDVDGKDYLSSEVFVDHKKNSSAFSVENQEKRGKKPEKVNSWLGYLL